MSEAPRVADLIDAHRELIDDMRGRLASHSLYRPEGDHDDLWALRFLLSHKKRPEKAAAAAASALEFREANGLDAIRAIVGRQPPSAWPANNRVVPWTGVAFYQPVPDGPVIVTGRLTDIKMKGLMENVDRDTYREAIFHLNEWITLTLDVTTRRTGRLTKCFRIFDASNMTVSGFHLGFVRMDSELQNQLQNVYPQLLAALVVVNLPSAVRWFWDQLLRPMMPARVVEKVTLTLTLTLTLSPEPEP